MKSEKSLAQEVHQKSDISDRRSKSWRGATYQGLSYTKNEYGLFYQKFDAKYFFIQQFFRKKLYFQRKPQKTVFGGAIDNFLGKEGVLRQKLTQLFYYKWGIEYFIIYQFFPKICNFLRKFQKSVSGAQFSFKEKETSSDENEYKLFYRKWGLEYFIV